MNAWSRKTEREHWVLGCVDMLPWASASDLSRCWGRSLPTCYQAMAYVEDRGEGRCVSVSTGGKVWRRLALVDYGRRGWLVRHQPDVVQWCCGKLELVEGTYRLLGDLVVAGRGRRLEEFRWEPAGLIEGVARFTDGWCVFSWSGRGETLWMLKRRLALVSERGFPGGGWPGRLFLIVPDRFQAALVDRAAAETGLGEWVVAVSVRGTLGRVVALDLDGSTGWYGAPRRPAEDADEVEVLGPGGVWVGGGARRKLRVLAVAEQWPGVDRPLLVRLSGCGRRGFGRELQGLLVGGLLEETGRGGYRCGEGWMAFAERRDGVLERDNRGPLNGRRRREWSRWLCGVVDRGWRVVPGWRAEGLYERGTPDVAVGYREGLGVAWRGVWGLDEARALFCPEVAGRD